MYAIVKTGGKQYTVKAGDVLDVEKLPGEAGDQVKLEVLLLSDGKEIITDAAKLADKVTAEIVDQHKGKKQLVFKFKKRKGYKRTKGHRQQLTKIAIVDVNGEKAEAPKAEEKPAEEPKAETVAAEAPKAEVKEAEKPAPEKEEAPKAEEKPAEEPKAEEPAAEEKADFSKMTVAQLKEYAKAHDIHIPSGARKAEIIETIENAQ